MPRKAPGPNNGVTEHRITLGDFERKQLTQAIDSYQADKILENTTNIVIAGAAVGAVAVGAYVAYNLYNVIPDLFKTDDEQRGGFNWLATWAGVGGQYDNFVKKEWKSFGIPMNAKQIPVQYAINQKVIADKLEKAKGAAQLMDKAGIAGGFGAFAKIAATSQNYIDIGHAKQLEQLEEWKLYYIEYYQNNPDIMDEV